jgi:hypothetical protein
MSFSDRLVRLRLVVFWLAPAIGPWAYYGQAAYGSAAPPAEAAFLADFLALREGRFTALLAGQGLVTIPKLPRGLRGAVYVGFSPGAFSVSDRDCVESGRDRSHVPRRLDLPAEMIWVAATIAVVRRIQGTPAQSAAAQEPALSPLQGVLREGGSS